MKKMKKNENVRKEKEDIKIEKEKGITLVALVITIVVLLVLAGITINFLLGPNSIFNMAQKAGEEMNKAVGDEQGGLGSIDNWLKEEGWANGAGENKGDLSIPTITIEGEQNNEIYTGTVKVTITDNVGENGSRAEKIKYVINGEEKYLNKTNNSFTIEDDGKYEVVAYMQDRGGNVSEPSETKTFMRDTTAPKVASITYKSKSPTTIKVEANGEDESSGIASYRFEYKLSTESEWKAKQTKDAPEGENKALEYTYTGMETAEIYNVRVVAIDKAGFEKPSASTENIELPNAPSFTEGPEVTAKTNTSMTITFTAKDKKVSKITYTVEYRNTETDVTKTQTLSNKTQGAKQTVTLSSLSNYTDYDITITASNGTNSNSSGMYEKTYCNKVAVCPIKGEYYTEINCTYCMDEGGSSPFPKYCPSWGGLVENYNYDTGKYQYRCSGCRKNLQSFGYRNRKCKLCDSFCQNASDFQVIQLIQIQDLHIVLNMVRNGDG